MGVSLLLYGGGPQTVCGSVWGISVSTTCRGLCGDAWDSLCGGVSVSVCGKDLGREVLRGFVVCGGSLCVSVFVYLYSVSISLYLSSILCLIISFTINFYPSTKP